MPAYAMIDEPLPGSTDVDGVAVAARAVELVAVERVVAAELVAHLVRHVVDGVEVADRRRDARAAARLVRAADDAEVGDAAARLAEREVADVVVRRADDLADHEARARRREQPVTCDCVKHAAAPQGPFGAVAASQVLRFSRSLLAMSCIRIDRSSS